LQNNIKVHGFTGQCFPSHKAIAIKARCGVRTVQRALKWAREHNLIQWAHGLVRDGWRVLRTSNRYAFAAFLTMRRVIASIAVSIHGARSVIARVNRDKHRFGHWISDLESRAHSNIVSVALANKLARIAWAVLNGGSDYRPTMSIATSSAA
jgi:hypothetical protein